MRRVLRIVLIVAVLSTVSVFSIQYIAVQSDIAAAASTEMDAADSAVIDSTVVEVGNLSVTVSATGAVQPVRQVSLLFDLSAPVTDILVEAGQYVEAGDVIARIDSTDFDANVEDAEIALAFQRLSFDAIASPPREVDLAVAQAAFDATQASYWAAASTGPTDNQVEVARLQTELARNQFWQTQLQFDPIADVDELDLSDLPPELADLIRQQIDALNGANQSQARIALTSGEYGVDIADANYSSVQGKGPDLGAVNSAYASRIQAGIALDNLTEGPGDTQLQLAQIDLTQTELALEQAQKARDLTALTAPFSGYITQNNLVVGELPPQNAAVLLMDFETFYVDLAIDETDVVQVREGMPVTFVVDAVPNAEITGTVERVAQVPQSFGQLVTYPVRVKLDPSDAGIRVGMTATARIVTRQLDDVLLLRNRFIRIDRSTQQAFVTIQRDNGRFAELPIELGVRSDTFSQVISGIDEGAEVVLVPDAVLTAGFGGPPSGN